MTENWVKHPTILSNDIVDLLPLETTHFDALLALSKEKIIWQYYIYDFSDSKIFLDSLQQSLEARAVGKEYPFVIFNKADQKIIGATKLWNIEIAHRKLEIGFTWMHPNYWGTTINTACKFLLLTFCFEQLKTLRVQLKTDENNIRSRKAIEKIGAKFEGIMRNDLLRQNNTHRNSAYFSIIEEDWASVKPMLSAKFLNN